MTTPFNGNIWFIGCPHFGHEKIISLANRPFKSVLEMNAQLVFNWNRSVGPEDTVYMLGDFAWGDYTQYAGLLSGKRVIALRGNHDHWMVGHDVFGQTMWFMSDGPYHEIIVGSQKIVMCHFPIEDWNGRYKGSIHLHCHTHQHELERPLMPMTEKDGFPELGNRMPKGMRCNRFNVTVEACHYMPISLSEILERAYDQ